MRVLLSPFTSGQLNGYNDDISAATTFFLIVKTGPPVSARALMHFLLQDHERAHFPRQFFSNYDRRRINLI